MLQLAVCFVALSWVALATSLAGRAARGIAVRFNWSDGLSLIDAAFLVFLLAVGFSILDGITWRFGTSGTRAFRETVGLPVRPSARVEWATGAAIGWAIVALSVLPMALAGKLHVRFWTEPQSFWLAALNLATVLLLALASEIAFRGLPYRRLMGAVGPFWATIVMSLAYGWVVTLRIGPLFFNGGDVSHAAMLIAVLLGFVLCWGWLRTHGLWLGWGLHFGWIASLGILFGLPVMGINNLSTVVDTRAIGADWLTGGEFGPEGAAITILLLFVGLVVLVRVSRDWAWLYTHSPIVAAGYPMDVPPPAAHAAMEQQPKPPVLVQILPTTPQGRSLGEQ